MMELVRAQEVDSDRLTEFFARSVLPGSIDFSIQRQGSFFDQYRVQSDDFETLILQDETKTIYGMASLVFNQGTVRGERQTWAYATDLRIAPTRKAIVQWAQHFLPVLQEACAARNCRSIFSCVEQHDNQAYNALIRPTSHTRRRLPRYQLLNRFRLIMLHGRIPFAKRALATIPVSPLELSDLDELCDFLRRRSAMSPLTALHDPESFLKKIKRWPGLHLDDFRVARDQQRRILGCAAVWKGTHVQALVPQNYHGFTLTAQQSLKVAGLFGIARPYPRPQLPMPFQYLTHLACDSGEVLHALIDEAFSRILPSEILAYLHFRGNWRTLPPPLYICTNLPFGLYMVLPPGDDTPTWPQPGMHHLAPEFEPNWI